MYVKVGDIRLFFDVEGAKLVPDGPMMREKPTLLCLHGGPGQDHSSLKPGFSALSQIAQVIYLDQRGNGRSARSTSEHWTLAQWADDVLGFCEALGIERPVVLGTSFGGYVAMEYAIRHPNHPAKLILISTALRGTSNRERHSRVLDMFERLGGGEAREVARRAFKDRTLEAYAEYRRVCGPLYTRCPPDPDASKRCISSQEVLAFFEGPGGEGATLDLHAELSRVRCPTLVIGGEDDPMTPITELQEIVAAFPEGLVRFEPFSHCGHGVYRDNPEGMLQVISEFLSC